MRPRGYTVSDETAIYGRIMRYSVRTFSTMRAFLKDRAGAVAVTVALAAVTLFVAAGVAIDMARAYRAKHALQYNVDQAAIAAAAVAYSEDPSADPDIDEMEEVAAKFFSANNALSEDLVVVTEPPQFSYSENTDDLIVSVPAKVETTFLKIVDINEIRFTVSSTAARPKWGPLELVLALDRTWSMSEPLNGTPRYKTLQTAASGLVDLILENPNAAVGIVPFSTYLRVDGNNPVTNKPYVDETWFKKPNLATAPSKICYPQWKKGCSTPTYDCVVDGVAQTCTAPETCTEYGPSYCVPSQLKKYANGCFMSRASKLDSIASPTNPPYWGLDEICNQTPILDLTKSEDFGGAGLSVVQGRIAAMVPVNDPLLVETYIGSGLEFGWHMLEPGQPLEKATSKADATRLGLTKAIVLMTDGANTVVPDSDTGWWDHDDLSPWDNPLPSQRADNATKSLCTNIKAAGIQIFTVAFSVNDADAERMLRDCASRPEYSYNATSSDALLDAFERIGAQLQSLRVKG